MRNNSCPSRIILASKQKAVIREGPKAFAATLTKRWWWQWFKPEEQQQWEMEDILGSGLYFSSKADGIAERLNGEF